MSSSFYNSSAWKRLRLAHLSASPWCVFCLELGLHVPGNHVDHVETIASRPDLKLDDDNLQTLCITCHSVKTQTTDRDGSVRGAQVDGTPRDPAHHWNQES